MAERERRHVRVAVIGSGFGGLGAAVRLRRQGITDFVILERAGAVGGTWRDNSYPGCACDVPSHLYSFSFAPNPEWPRNFSGQPHIRAYLERVADTFGLRPHLRLDSEVRSLRWDAERAALGGGDGRRAADRGRRGVRDRAAVGSEDSRTYRGWTPSPGRSRTPRAGTTTTTCAPSAWP